MASSTNGLAIASLILGVVWIYGVGSVLAVIVSLIAISQIDRHGGMQKGKGMAIAGLLLGLIGIGVLPLLV